MAKIALWNMESKYKNLAIEKIRIYHQQRGNEVVDYSAIEEKSYDLIYCSSIFDFTDKNYVPSRAICGGTGFDLTTVLPTEIELIKPHMNWGFTTRGCIRNCPFCVVPRKEGDIKIYEDIYDIWDGKTKSITLMDNNILALPDYFKFICGQIRNEKLTVDINQGLDIRLLTEDLANELATISHVEYYFAFDFVELENVVREKVELLKKYNINRSTFYVLVGFNTTFEQDLYRCNVLRELGQKTYIMRYVRDKKYIPLARWANQHHIFYSMTWDEFINRPENKKYTNETILAR